MNKTCQHSDRDVASLKCGYPLPCPHHQKPTVTREWIEDLRDLLFDWEHSHEEPVDRSGDQKPTDEIWGEIVKMFESKGFEAIK